MAYVANVYPAAGNGNVDAARSWRNIGGVVYSMPTNLPVQFNDESAGTAGPEDRWFYTWRYYPTASTVHITGTLRADANALNVGGVWTPGTLYTYNWELVRGHWGAGQPLHDQTGEVLASGSILADQITTDGYNSRFGEAPLDVTIPVDASEDLQLYVRMTLSPTITAGQQAYLSTDYSLVVTWQTPVPAAVCEWAGEFLARGDGPGWNGRTAASTRPLSRCSSRSARRTHGK